MLNKPQHAIGWQLICIKQLHHFWTEWVCRGDGIQMISDLTKGAALIINDIDNRMFSIAWGMRSKIWKNIKSGTSPNNEIYFALVKRGQSTNNALDAVMFSFR